MKGVCNIKVVNEDGTIAQDVTDENMVTDYLEKLINPDYRTISALFGSDNVLPYDCALYPLIDKTIGGIFLFGENIPEETICKLPTAPLVGHASSVHPYSLPTCGMFNVNESEEIKDAHGNFIGYKFVWDFSTDRANGTIKCVSLTTGQGGQKGYAQAIDGKLSNSMFFSPLGPYPSTSTASVTTYYTPNICETRTQNYMFDKDNRLSGHEIKYGPYGGKTTRYGSSSMKLIGNLEKDFLVYVSGMTKNSITFTRFKIKTSLGLSDRYYTVRERMQQDLENTIIFDRDVFTSYDIGERLVGLKIYTDDKYIYVSSTTAHEVFIYKINPSTLQIIETINDTFDDLTFAVANQRSPGCVLFEGYYYAMILKDTKDGTSYPCKLYMARINSKDKNDYELLFELWKYSSLSSISSIASVGYSIYGDILFIVMLGDNGYMNGSVSIKNNKIIHYGNTSIPIFSANLDFPYCILKQCDYAVGINDFYGYGICTHGLITIDNLSTPIIKNSTQTMKITYEITEVDETV